MKLLINLVVAGLTAVWLVGCKPAAEVPPLKPPGSVSNSENAHDHGAGPHDGTIGEFGGGKYHMEFVVDHDKQEATVYILGGDVKSPAPIKIDKLTLAISDPEFSVDLMAQPLEGEAAGESSRFVGTHESLGKVQEFAGTVTGEVEGTPLSGEFKEEPHTHEPKP